MPSTAPARPRTRPHAVALLLALAAALLAVPAAASAASHGVQRLRATRHVTTRAAARRGLTVKAVVPRRDHALRLTLTRRGKVVARRTFRLRRGGRVALRWHVRRLGAGRYLLRARSGRSGRSLRGRARRAAVVVRRSATAPAPTTTAPVPAPAPAAISAGSPCGARAPGAPGQARRLGRLREQEVRAGHRQPERPDVQRAWPASAAWRRTSRPRPTRACRTTSR